jgi:Fic family protein
MLEVGPGRFEGGLTQRKYLGMTGVSPATAWRDIEHLLKIGLITPGDGAGRSTYYNVAIPGWAWSREGNVASRP